MEESKLENRLTSLESGVQYLAQQVDNIKEMQTEIRDLALSVNSLAGSVKRLCEDASDTSCRIKLLEDKPGKRLEMIIAALIGLIVSGVGGFILGKLLGGQ